MALHSGHVAPAINRFFCFTTLFLTCLLFTFYRTIVFVDTIDIRNKIRVTMAAIQLRHSKVTYL